jgi:hypothetical protein
MASVFSVNNNFVQRGKSSQIKVFMRRNQSLVVYVTTSESHNFALSSLTITHTNLIYHVEYVFRQHARPLHERRRKKWESTLLRSTGGLIFPTAILIRE